MIEPENDVSPVLLAEFLSSDNTADAISRFFKRLNVTSPNVVYTDCCATLTAACIRTYNSLEVSDYCGYLENVLMESVLVTRFNNVTSENIDLETFVVPSEYSHFKRVTFTADVKKNHLDEMLRHIEKLYDVCKGKNPAYQKTYIIGSVMSFTTPNRVEHEAENLVEAFKVNASEWEVLKHMVVLRCVTKYDGRIVWSGPTPTARTITVIHWCKVHFIRVMSL